MVMKKKTTAKRITKTTKANTPKLAKKVTRKRTAAKK